MKTVLLPLALLLAALVGGASLTAASCGNNNVEAAAGAPPQKGSKAKALGSSRTKAPAAESARLVTRTEPREQAYTVKVPEGWKNRTALVQVYDQKRPLVTAMNPQGNTFVFMGDPQMPGFVVPSPQYDPNDSLTAMMEKSNPLLKTAPFQPAREFFTNYLTKKFGKLPEFRILGAGPNPRLDTIARASAKRLGFNGELTTTLIAFDYRDNGKLIHSLVNGLTLKSGSIWVADLSGISSTDDPIKYHGLLLGMTESFRTNPRWQEQQRALSQQRHEATMAMIEAGTVAMTRRHEANMAAIQASSARHQQRMASLQAAGDARVNAWKQQQAQSDASQERFLNYIKGENTVVNGSGVTSQVEAGQGRYFRNKSDNTYIGMDSTKELEDLRKIWGLNPDDYEDVRIKP